MSLTVIKIIGWWHRRFGHPHRFPVTTWGRERVTIVHLCTCGSVFRAQGVIVVVEQQARVRVRAEVVGAAR